MRILKVVLALLLAVLTVATGFFVIAIVAIAYLLFVFARWGLRRFGPAPTPAASAPPAEGGVIDVTATEVRDDAPRGGGPSP